MEFASSHAISNSTYYISFLLFSTALHQGFQDSQVNSLLQDFVFDNLFLLCFSHPAFYTSITGIEVTANEKKNLDTVRTWWLVMIVGYRQDKRTAHVKKQWQHNVSEQSCWCRPEELSGVYRMIHCLTDTSFSFLTTTTTMSTARTSSPRVK